MYKTEVTVGPSMVVNIYIDKIVTEIMWVIHSARECFKQNKLRFLDMLLWQ